MNGNFNHYDPYYDGYHNDFFHPGGRSMRGGRNNYENRSNNKENRHKHGERDEEFVS